MKYRNKKLTVDGVTWDSQKEYKRWYELNLLQKAGQISELERQVTFRLEVNGQLICKYIADFCYIENGKRIIEDTKSSFTKKLPVYRLKYKLMKAIHGIEIRD